MYPGKLNTLKHTLDVVYNPATQSITATNRFKTDSKLFGRVVRVLDVDFKRSLNASTDMINAALAINYNMPSWGTEEVKQWKFDVKHDMHKRSWSENFAKGYTWSHRVQQNRFSFSLVFINVYFKLNSVLKTNCTILKYKNRIKS